MAQPTLVRGKEATDLLLNSLLNRVDLMMALKRAGIEFEADRLDEFMPERWMTLADVLGRLI